MNVRLRELAARQADLVAAWQLRDAGWTWRKIQHHAAEDSWQVIHRGIYALTMAPLTQRQNWIAATLTAPDTFLSHASAGNYYGFRPFNPIYETVTRPGTGGPRRFGKLLILRSTTLAGNTTVRAGIPITTPERALIELTPNCDERQTARMVREAIRLKLTTTARLDAALASHPNHRGTHRLRCLSRRYAKLPIRRARHDSEAVALAILQDAGIELPRVNVRIAGEEADLVWDGLIVEIDGPQFHQFREEDLRKQALWEKAGYVVRRVPSDDVYDRPDSFIALVRRALADSRGLRGAH